MLRRKADEDNVFRWTASKALDYFIDEVEKADLENEAREWQNVLLAFAKELGQHLQNSKEDEEMETLVARIEKIHKGVTAKSPHKRVASSDLAV